MRGDAPPLAETEPHTDRAQSEVSQTSAERLAKALEALALPGEEAKADDQTRAESLRRRIEEKRLGDLDQGEMDLLATLLRGGLTSTKVSPTQRTQSKREKLIIDTHRQMAHGMTQRVRRVLTNKYVWPKMTSDILSEIAKCSECPLAKAKKNIKHIQPILHN